MRVRKKDFGYVSGKKYDGMMGRCYRENDKAFPAYGGRGIRVDREWIEDIANYRAWLRAELERLGIDEEDFLAKPVQYQVDRIDVDGHYTPENCRISSPQENGRNKRASKRRVLIAADGSSVSI